MLSMEREPTSPGEILDEEFLKPLCMTQKNLADRLGCDVKVVNRIVNRRTAVTAAMAVRLASFFGTTPEFWLNAQQAVDLFHARKKMKRVPKPLESRPAESIRTGVVAWNGGISAPGKPAARLRGKRKVSDTAGTDRVRKGSY